MSGCPDRSTGREGDVSDHHRDGPDGSALGSSLDAEELDTRQPHTICRPLMPPIDIIPRARRFAVQSPLSSILRKPSRRWVAATFV
jgi:hypothetical protein